MIYIDLLRNKPSEDIVEKGIKLKEKLESMKEEERVEFIKKKFGLLERFKGIL